MSSARVYLSSGAVWAKYIDSIKKLTSSALLWYTLVLINVALPLRTWTPPPCQKVKHISTKGLVDSSKDKHTQRARLSYTLMLASVAVPSMERPPPTCVKRSKRCVPAVGTGNYSWVAQRRAVAHISCRHVSVHADRLENRYASRGYEEATTSLCQE